MNKLPPLFSFPTEDYDKIKEEVWDESWHSLNLFSALAAISFAVMAIISFFPSAVSGNRIAYIVHAFVSLAFYGVSFMRFKNIRAKEFFVYAFYASLLIFGIVTGAVFTPETLTVNYIAMMLVVPLLFIARAWIVNTLTFSSIFIYIVLAYFTQENANFLHNLIHVFSYGLLSVVIVSAIMRNKMQRLLYQSEMAALERAEKESQEKIRHKEIFIADMLRYASSEEEPDRVLNQLVKYLGEKLRSDRAYIFEENASGTFDNTYEWCRDGITREIDTLQGVPYEGVIEVWYELYRSSKNVVIHDVEKYRDTSEKIYNILKSQGVNTLVTGPIIVEGKIIGFYGVDNPPVELLNDVSVLLEMMEFIISFVIRLRNNAKSLEYGALHDQLTGCKNRKALDWVYSNKNDPREPLAVVVCDLNGLKEINDRQGHDAGDLFIQRTSEALKSVFGQENIYRLGGDEFGAVIKNISKHELDEMLDLARLQLGTTASLGSAYREGIGPDFNTLFKLADMEMYRQKSRYYNDASRDRRSHNS